MSTVKANEYRQLNNSGTNPNLTFAQNASVEVGNDLTVPQGDVSAVNMTASGTLSVGGNASIGDAPTDAHTVTGTLAVTKTLAVTEAITATAGVIGDIKDTGGNVVVDVNTGNNATFNGDLTGDVTGNIKGDLKSPDGTVVVNNGTGSGTDSTFTGNAASSTKLATARSFSLSGDVVASAQTFDGTGNVTLSCTIQPDSVGLGDLADISNQRILGRSHLSDGSVAELTGATVTSLLSTFATSTKGLVPGPSGSQTGLFLKGDGSWANPLTGAVFSTDLVINTHDIGEGNNSVSTNLIFGKDAGSSWAATSSNNTAIGYEAQKLTSTTNASDNTAVGSHAMKQNTDGNSNTAVGYLAGMSIFGHRNTCVGRGAGYVGNNAAGDDNTQIGCNAGFQTVSGQGNTIIGYSACGDTLSNSSASIYAPQQQVQNLIAIGRSAGTSSSPSGNLSNKRNILVLGDNNITAFYCAVNTINTSDKRDKADINDFSHGLNWIKKMNPVTYRWDYRSDYLTDEVTEIEDVTKDGSKKRPKLFLGLIGQDMMEIEKADGFSNNRDDQLIVNENEDGKTLGIGYSNIVPVLINAVKELSTQVESLTTRVAALEG